MRPGDKHAMQCDFKKLVWYLDKKLSLDGQVQLLLHLDRCEACFDALYQILRDRAERRQFGDSKLKSAG
jgi:hypothetical protein